MRPKLAAGVTAGLGAALALRTLFPQERYDFKHRVVLITGGSRGLGLVMARQLADEGARLVILARDADELTRAAQDLRFHGAEVLTLICDVSDQGQVNAAIGHAIDHFGRIDVLINNAGVIQGGPMEHMRVEDFQDAMAVHLWGSLYTIQAVFPHMRQQRGGRIVNIASIGGLVSVPHLLPYCASKYALVGLSDGMRAELAKYGIRVTTVCPGLMRTGSHVNALFKGRHQAEYTVFSILDALPLASIDARKAARQIIEACRRGDPQLTITFQARLLAFANALAPALVAQTMALANRLLPQPTGREGDELKSGWESQTALAPSLLTRPADQAIAPNNERAEHDPRMAGATS